MREYPIFTLVVITIIISLGFQIAGLQTVANWLLIIMSSLAILPIVKGMAETVREGGFGLDILALTAILVSLFLGEYWTAIVIVLMLTGGEALEEYAEGRATRELTALLERAPKLAHLLVDGRTKDIPAENIKVGDKIIVKPGETIPVDATLLDGFTSLDESSLTGESLPVPKKSGDQVLSGAINLDSPITLKALSTSGDSQYAQIIKLVKEATSSKSPFVRLADRYSLPFTIISFAIASATWALTGDIKRFLEVIVVATPCPLLLGAPIAIISGMSRAAKHGIIIKNGASLEKLAAAKSVAFDKTGTLTKGKPVVDQIVTFNGYSREEILSLAAAVEHKSAHVLAQAVVEAAAKQNLKLVEVNSISEVPGVGLKASWQGKETIIGSQTFIKEESIEMPESLELKASQTTAYVAIDGKLAGAITFIDEIREESVHLVDELQQMGLQHISMLTGDNKNVAQNIAKQLKIKEVYHSLLPADKVRVIKNIPSEFHPTAMVGDGVNDAPVLAASDVGIALGARGSTAASESANVVIMLDDIARVSKAISIAKNTIHIGLQSILVGIAISVGLMLIFATGKFKPVYGAAIQEMVDVVVILNALRAHGHILQTLFGRFKRT